MQRCTSTRWWIQWKSVALRSCQPRCFGPKKECQQGNCYWKLPQSTFWSRCTWQRTTTFNTEYVRESHQHRDTNEKQKERTAVRELRLWSASHQSWSSFLGAGHGNSRELCAGFQLSRKLRRQTLLVSSLPQLRGQERTPSLDWASLPNCMQKTAHATTLKRNQRTQFLHFSN